VLAGRECFIESVNYVQRCLFSQPNQDKRARVDLEIIIHETLHDRRSLEMGLALKRSDGRNEESRGGGARISKELDLSVLYIRYKRCLSGQQRLPLGDRLRRRDVQSTDKQRVLLGVDRR